MDLFSAGMIYFHDTEHTYSRIPTVLLDDVPVASGFGTLELAVPPGAYVLTVQCFGNERSSTSRPITVEESGVQHFHYEAPDHIYYYTKKFNVVQVHRDSDTVGSLGPARDRPPPHSQGTAIGFVHFVFSFLVGMAVFFGFGTYFDVPTLLRVPYGAEGFVLGLPPLLIAAVITKALYRKWDANYADLKERYERATVCRPVATATPNEGIRRLIALGSNPSHYPQPTPGYAGIVLNLDIGTRYVKLDAPKSFQDTQLPWRESLKPPAVEINDVPLRSGWGKWFIEVTPGPHRLRLQLPGFAGGTKLIDNDFPADDTVAIDATAHALYQWDHQRVVKETISWTRPKIDDRSSE